MYLNSFIYRLKKLIFQITRNPLIILKVFNIKKIARVIKQLSNVQVSFRNLKKDYQLQVVFNTFKKIDLISNENSILKNSFVKEKNIEEFENQYSDDENCNKLKKLFDKYGSDKTTSSLVYIYFHIFNNYKIQSLFEIGLGTNNIKVRSNMGLDGTPGASLRAFRDYLNIKVYGADVDKEILFEEDSIKTFFIDQMNEATITNIKKVLPKCDLIIDDGLHQPDANLNVIYNLLDHLNTNGILVIEDIEPDFKNIFKIIENIFSNTQLYRSSLIKIRKNGYCLLIQKLN